MCSRYSRPPVKVQCDSLKGGSYVPYVRIRFQLSIFFIIFVGKLL